MVQRSNRCSITRDRETICSVEIRAPIENPRAGRKVEAARYRDNCFFSGGGGFVSDGIANTTDVGRSFFVIELVRGWNSST